MVQAQPLHLVYDMVVNVILLLVLHVVALTHLVRKIVVVVFVLYETEEAKLMNLFAKKTVQNIKIYDLLHLPEGNGCLCVNRVITDA